MKATKQEPQKPRRYLVFLLVLALATAVILGFLYYRASKQLAASKDPALQAKVQKQEIQDLMAEIGKHIILPTNELPVLATVTDATTLAAQQPFYAQAQNGDKLLVYVQSQRAILYSPARKIIVNVGPLVGAGP